MELFGNKEYLDKLFQPSFKYTTKINCITKGVFTEQFDQDLFYSTCSLIMFKIPPPQ